MLFPIRVVHPDGIAMNNVRATRSSTFASSISTTGRILRRQLWLWPLFAAIGLTLVGWSIHSSVESAIKQKLAEELKTILHSELAALEIWFDTRKQFVHALAIAPVTKPLVIAQIELAAQPGTTNLDLLQSESLGTLRGHLAMFLEPLGYNGFLVFDREKRIVAADGDHAVGRRSLAGYDQLIDKALGGKVTVSRPFPSALLLRDEQGKLKAVSLEEILSRYK